MKNRLLVLAVVSALTLSIGLFGCDTSSKQTTTSSSQSSSEASSADSSSSSASESANLSPKAEVVSITRDKDDDYGYFEADIKIKNISEETLTFTGVNVEELDKNGDILDSYASYNTNAVKLKLKPGQSGSISLTMSANDGIAGLGTYEYYYEDSAGDEITEDFASPVTVMFDKNN